MWADFMKQAVELRPSLGGASFAKPSGIVSVGIDPTTGCLAGPESPFRRMEMFIAGTEPSSTCIDSTVADLEEIPEIDGELQADDSESEADESDEEQWFWLVCALTGLRASPDCLRTEKRTFERDREPRISCRAEFHRN
jgi:membrane carboxypeptidase/penicillin-binding protein